MELPTQCLYLGCSLRLDREALGKCESLETNKVLEANHQSRVPPSMYIYHIGHYHGYSVR